jgi:fused signal recognition particle receptor
MATLFRRQGEKKSLWQRIREVALADVNVVVRGLDSGSIEALEEVLLTSDFGVPATMRLIDHVEDLARRGRIRTEAEFRGALEAAIGAVLAWPAADLEIRFAPAAPTVILLVGVNGVGKTTTAGKLAHRLRAGGRSVLMAAGDTFRAGAIDQLAVWAGRVGADFVGAKPGADPAAVAFDAVEAALTRGTDVVLVDTAGRLHTQGDLMAELSKVHRVVARKLAGAPHETLLVLDATVGQTAIAQGRTFAAALPLTGLVLAKLDSTARGGVVVALVEELKLPVKLVGTGESVDKLEVFDAASFARSILAA